MKKLNFLLILFLLLISCGSLSEAKKVIKNEMVMIAVPLEDIPLKFVTKRIICDNNDEVADPAMVTLT